MNKTRRAALNALQDRITELAISDLFPCIEAIADELETLKDEEAEAFDNLPQSLQEGEKGQDMQAAVDSMESALELLRAFADLETNADDAFANIEDAKGNA